MGRTENGYLKVGTIAVNARLIVDGKDVTGNYAGLDVGVKVVKEQVEEAATEQQTPTEPAEEHHKATTKAKKKAAE